MGGGTGGFGRERRQAYGQYAYSWQEGRAHVSHRLILHAVQEIDILERLQLSENGEFLLFQQDLYSGSRVVRRKEEFPITES